MHLTIEGHIPELSEIAFGLGADFYETEFYNNFESENERIIASPESFSKILELSKTNNLGYKIAEDYFKSQGLADVTDAYCIDLLDIKVIDGKIIQIPILYHCHISDLEVVDFIKESKQHLLKSVNSKRLQIEALIQVKGLFKKTKGNSELVVSLHATYPEKIEYLPLLEKLDKKRVRMKVDIQVNGECKIHLDTHYIKELNHE